uniref:B3 domain-containing transcription factor NGA4-like n=1 Tax=Populus alba TaxID=43335 RepID=A0A4U5QS67_POPAL|nr:B3 domain-containing transcription factor NGA4-like [Populus alba]
MATFSKILGKTDTSKTLSVPTKSLKSLPSFKGGQVVEFQGKLSGPYKKAEQSTNQGRKKQNQEGDFDEQAKNRGRVEDEERTVKNKKHGAKTQHNPDPDLKGEASTVFSSSSQGPRKQGKTKEKREQRVQKQRKAGGKAISRGGPPRCHHPRRLQRTGFCDQLVATGRPIDDTDKVHRFLADNFVPKSLDIFNAQRRVSLESFPLEDATVSLMLIQIRS